MRAITNKKQIFLIGALVLCVFLGVYIENRFEVSRSLEKVVFRIKRYFHKIVFIHPNDDAKNFVGDSNLIANFEADNDLSMWEDTAVYYSRSKDGKSEGDYSLKLEYPAGEYPGLNSKYNTKGRDWSNYKYLKFDVFNPEEAEVKFCFILKGGQGGRYAQRYDGIFNLKQGMNNLSFELGNLKSNDGSNYIDLTKIIQYVFCLIKPVKPTTLYLDNIRLIPEEDETKNMGPARIDINVTKRLGNISPYVFGSNLGAGMTYTVDATKFAKDIGLSIFRFPGGRGMGYHWKTGIFDFGSKNPNLFPLSNYDKLLEYCKRADTQLILQVNIESGTPQEAAEWVRYTNKEIGFYVRYWNIGNEPYGDWEKSYRTPEEYANTLKEFSKAMKAVDPTIKIIAEWGNEYHGDWDKTIVREAGEYIDAVSCHWYPNHDSAKKKYKNRSHPDPMDVVANPFKIPDMVERMKMIIKKECPQKKGEIEFAFLEWDGAWDAPSYDPPPYEQGIVQWSLANGLFYAEALAQFIGSGVTLAANHDFQETPFGLIRGHYVQNPNENVMWDGKTIRPKALAIKMFSKHFGDALVQTKVSDSPSYVKAPDWNPASYAGEVPYLTSYASVNEAGNKLYVMLINRHPHMSLKTEININGFNYKPDVKSWTLTGPEITSQNDGNPGNVRIFEGDVVFSGADIKYECPAHAVVSLEFDKSME